MSHHRHLDQFDMAEIVARMHEMDDDAACIELILYARRTNMSEVEFSVLLETLMVQDGDPTIGLHIALIPRLGRYLPIEFAQTMVDLGARVDAVWDGGMRTLHLACMLWSDMQYLRLFVQEGANVNCPSHFSFGIYPLHSTNIEGLRILLEANANPLCKEARFGNTPLMHAALADSAEAVALLLQYGPQAACMTNNAGGTPLHLAQSTRVARMLLEAKADVHATTETEELTPLINAAKLNCQSGVIALLLKHGANVHAHTKTYKRTALTYAIRRQRSIDLLLAAGADPCAPGVCRERILAMPRMRMRALTRGRTLHHSVL